MNDTLFKQAASNIQDILTHAIEYKPNEKAIVIYDLDYPLTNILVEGYKTAFTNLKANVQYYNFADISIAGKAYVISLFDMLKESDTVVLIQSSNFRLDDFRIRLHLFSKKLKVIEHMHLYRNDESVFDVYINSLKYDLKTRNWYNNMANQLVNELSTTESMTLSYQDATLTTQNLEIPKINIGNYSNMDNIGGTFPIGEVFTEAKDFGLMNGSIYIYAFANREFNISYYEPFRLDIKEGVIIGFGKNTPAEFTDVYNLVTGYERALIREIGFGLNSAITRDRPLGDITAFERILGIHMSLGEKHSVYKKVGITTHKTKFHVDLFLCVDSIRLTKEGKQKTIFNDGKYCLVNE
jgi:aminopeptidase